MRTTAQTSLVQDEIFESCSQCGKPQLVAYWDEELEYYIYLKDLAAESDDVDLDLDLDTPSFEGIVCACCQEKRPTAVCEPA